MANVGLKRFFYSKLAADTEENGCTYVAEPVELSKPIESKFSPELAEAELYAGDELSEYAAEYAKGTLTIGIKDDDDEEIAGLLGNTVKVVTLGTGESAVTGKEVISGGTDLGDFHSFAQVFPKVVDGVRKWKAEVAYKVRFKPYEKERKTKGSSLEFATPSVEGIIFLNKQGNYECHATWDTEEDAINYIKHSLPVAETGNGGQGT